MIRLSTLLHRFFDSYLPQLKGVSPNTIKSYRDGFKLFLDFASKQCAVKVDSLSLHHLCPEIILSFLDHIEKQRCNIPRTRNLRLATFKSLAKMIRLYYPEHKPVADQICAIPQKRAQKQLIGFLSSDEILKLFAKVDMKKPGGFRDYTLLHLMIDSGARASEIATAKLDDFDPDNSTIAVLGKANRYRLIALWPITVELLKHYTQTYRTKSRWLFKKTLFINQRGEAFTRHGINRICKKYLTMALPEKRVKQLNPAHCFRHSCAMNLLAEGKPLSHIQNHLGHENIQSTMTYLHQDLTRSREAQQKFTDHCQKTLIPDTEIDELIDWDNKENTLEWLDSL